MVDESPNQSVLISVIVCTYNRSQMLKGCLESLCAQSLSKDQYEIIIVDNGSTDDTHEVVNGFPNLGNIRYCVETQPGLSYARNRGLREANGKYAAYIDDDARAAPDWLEVALVLFETEPGGIDCLGGPYHPFYTSPKPKWFKDVYEVRGFGDQARFLGKNEYPSGANMIWTIEKLTRVGGFDVDLGVVGNQLRLGEETAAFDKLKELDTAAKIYYSPALIIYHWVPGYKMTVRYRLKRRFMEGQYQAIGLETKGIFERLGQIGHAFLSLIKASIRFFLKVKSYPYMQNWIVEAGGYVARCSGQLLGLLGIFPKIKQG